MEISKKLQRVCLAAALSAMTCITFANSDADLIITKNVESNLSKVPGLEGLHLSVTTNDATVSVSGAVNTREQVKLIKEAAQATPGVKNIDTSKLSDVKSEHPIDDSIITSKIKAHFIKEKLMGDQAAPSMDMHVETKDGVVYLTGKTEKEEQLKRAVEIARSIKGVKDVNQKVIIGNNSNKQIN